MAPSRPLPTGSASVHSFAGRRYHSSSLAGIVEASTLAVAVRIFGAKKAAVPAKTALPASRRDIFLTSRSSVSPRSGRKRVAHGVGRGFVGPPHTLLQRPGGPTERSPRREPWDPARRSYPQPRRGDRDSAGGSVAPPGLIQSGAAPRTHGLRHGLRSVGPPGLWKRPNLRYTILGDLYVQDG